MKIRSGMVTSGEAWYGKVRTWSGVARSGVMRFGRVRLGKVG
jgi:hypothetical protein